MALTRDPSAATPVAIADMMAQQSELDCILPTRKSGSEIFRLNQGEAEIRLLDFWQWSASDLVSNATRGRLAEFIVASALGLASGVRDEWDPFDLITPAGLKIEVKSSAYLQTWKQSRLSSIVFATPKTRAWDPQTARLQLEPVRQAHVYIFALLAHREAKASLDPMNLDQWHFFIVPTHVLDGRPRSQHSITLKSLQALCPDHFSFSALAEAVRRLEAELLPA